MQYGNRQGHAIGARCKELSECSLAGRAAPPQTEVGLGALLSSSTLPRRHRRDMYSLVAMESLLAGGSQIAKGGTVMSFDDVGNVVLHSHLTPNHSHETPRSVLWLPFGRCRCRHIPVQTAGIHLLHMTCRRIQSKRSRREIHRLSRSSDSLEKCSSTGAARTPHGKVPQSTP